MSVWGQGAGTGKGQSKGDDQRGGKAIRNNFNSTVSHAHVRLCAIDMSS